MTAALSRLDNAPVLLPEDTAMLAVFERHLQAAQPSFCLICGTEGQGQECDSCYAGHDKAVERSADV